MFVPGDFILNQLNINNEECKIFPLHYSLNMSFKILNTLIGTVTIQNVMNEKYIFL
jgi:hypothetical protein